MQALNLSIFQQLNAGAQPSPAILEAARFIAQWLSLSVPLLLTGLWLWGAHPRRQAALRALLTIGLGLGFGQLVTALWPQPRPFMVGLGHTYLTHLPDPGFPSDHAIVFFTLAASLWLSAQRVLAAVFLLGGLLIGWARVYLGVHFPFDIAGALLVGLLSAWLLAALWTERGWGERLFRWLEGIYRHLFALPITRGWMRR